MRLRGHGVTRLADALQAASEQLAQARAPRRVVILLSDCRSTEDDDTVETARALPELIILAPADDHAQAAQLASQSAPAGRRSSIRWTRPRSWTGCSKPVPGSAEPSWPVAG